jgi:hypothetical protein
MATEVPPPRAAGGGLELPHQTPLPTPPAEPHSPYISSTTDDHPPIITPTSPLTIFTAPSTPIPTPTNSTIVEEVIPLGKGNGVVTSIPNAANDVATIPNGPSTYSTKSTTPTITTTPSTPLTSPSTVGNGNETVVMTPTVATLPPLVPLSPSPLSSPLQNKRNNPAASPTSRQRQYNNNQVSAQHQQQQQQQQHQVSATAAASSRTPVSGRPKTVQLTHEMALAMAEAAALGIPAEQFAMFFAQQQQARQAQQQAAAAASTHHHHQHHMSHTPSHHQLQQQQQQYMNDMSTLHALNTAAAYGYAPTLSSMYGVPSPSSAIYPNVPPSPTPPPASVAAAAAAAIAASASGNHPYVSPEMILQFMWSNPQHFPLAPPPPPSPVLTQQLHFNQFMATNAAIAAANAHTNGSVSNTPTPTGSGRSTPQHQHHQQHNGMNGLTNGSTPTNGGPPASPSPGSSTNASPATTPSKRSRRRANAKLSTATTAAGGTPTGPKPSMTNGFYAATHGHGHTNGTNGNSNNNSRNGTPSGTPSHTVRVLSPPMPLSNHSPATFHAAAAAARAAATAATSSNGRPLTLPPPQLQVVGQSSTSISLQWHPVDLACGYVVDFIPPDSTTPSCKHFSSYMAHPYLPMLSFYSCVASTYSANHHL